MGASTTPVPWSISFSCVFGFLGKCLVQKIREGLHSVLHYLVFVRRNSPDELMHKQRLKKRCNGQLTYLSNDYSVPRPSFLYGDVHDADDNHLVIRRTPQLWPFLYFIAPSYLVLYISLRIRFIPEPLSRTQSIECIRVGANPILTSTLYLLSLYTETSTMSSKVSVLSHGSIIGLPWSCLFWGGAVPLHWYYRIWAFLASAELSHSLLSRFLSGVEFGFHHYPCCFGWHVSIGVATLFKL